MHESPEAMVLSFDTMPFVKHDRKNNYMSCKNMFMEGGMNYRKLEEGLWMIYGDIYYKKNILYKRSHDPDQVSDYYILGIESLINDGRDRPSLVNGVPHTNVSWLAFKPKVSDQSCYFKKTKALSAFIYFNEAWFQTQLKGDTKFVQSKFQKFFPSDSEYILWPDSTAETQELAKSIETTIRLTNEGENAARLKDCAWQLIHVFCEKYLQDSKGAVFEGVPENANNAIWKAERILRNGVFRNFIGIGPLSSKVGISETNLKAFFKRAFGKTVFQYFRDLQMEEAKIRLLEGDLSVKEIAQLFQYENGSKFAQAFKKHHGTLPSELKNNTIGK